MRVLMTADTVGGVWTYALELIRALGAYNTRVCLATMGHPPSPEQHAEIGRIKNATLFESNFKLEWMDEPWADVERAGHWLLDLDHRLQPDVIHLNGYAHAALPWRAPTLVAGHSCVLSWWRAVKGETAPHVAWDRYQREVRRGLQAADRVVAPSRWMLDALEEHYGRLRRTKVILNGRDPALFTTACPKEKFVFTAGRVWDAAKNIRALEQIAHRLPWPVYVAGEAKHPDGDETTREPAANVNFLGRLSAEPLRSWLARAWIYALPARYEPFGLSVLEAALAGCALVLGDIPPLREIWGGAAVFVPPGDARALSNAIEELATNDERRERLAERARARARELTPARMAREYQSLYADLMAGGSSRNREARENIACAS